MLDLLIGKAQQAYLLILDLKVSCVVFLLGETISSVFKKNKSSNKLLIYKIPLNFSQFQERRILKFHVEYEVVFERIFFNSGFWYN